ncbi:MULTISPECIES: flagellar hook-length control protein FliK [unclassified Achromobacter]|uniref:flagellar hook-length control protein FliK n=1 Tax=unclassified Achromobacter TaxID=2626865 RepID=UPI000B51B95B|nr:MULTISPECIES: flagellar hook-length control protein FliK [unclassified Achromobacter]OWT79984.1 flagellar hook-length control protein FliK [Achromobacter sp. HZ34]OWT81868.1 flagellar hook-length control protein FliK [Achromobacter sp. HZ28]
MSIGPTALSSVLVQRLDAVLGTQLAQQGKDNTRLDAVTPPGSAVDIGADGDVTQQGPQNKAIQEIVAKAELNAATRARYLSADITGSAPTILGQTARTILTLLAQYPDTAPALAGKNALWAEGEDAPEGALDTPDGQAEGGGATRGQAPASAPAAGTAAANANATANANGRGVAGNPAGQAGAADAQDEAAATRANTAALAGEAAEGADGAQAGAQAAAASRARLADAALATLASRAPAMPGAGPQPAQLAQALKQTLQQSGLFYESHLADMAFGQRDAAELAREPQARLNPDVMPRINPAGENRSLLADNLRFGLPTTSSPMTFQADGQPTHGTAVTWSGSQPGQAPTTPPGIHPDAALLVRQQLEVFANQTLAWEGTAWQGAPMWWEIRREQDDTIPGSNPVEAGQSWATRLVLNLPRLGTVEVRMNLAGNQLVMNIVAPQSDTEISQAGIALRQRMHAAGLTLSDLTVAAHAPALEELF